MWLTSPRKRSQRHLLNGNLLSGIVLALILATAIVLPTFAQLQWKDVNSGLEQGKREHKYVLADVYTDWCGWCKRLDRDTFSNTDLIHYLDAKFVCVKANAEDNGPGKQLASNHGVNGYPCALIFDPSGKLIGKISGYREAKAYQDALNQIVSTH